jgi:hypothetical protein
MKKLILCAIAGLFAGIAYAGYDFKDFSVTITSTNVGTATGFIRGKIQNVRVIVPSAGTCTVAVVSSENTILSKSAIAASATFTPRILADTPLGAASTNGMYDAIACASAITTTVTGASANTNSLTYRVRVIYEN